MTLMSSVLKHALQSGLISRNPTEAVKRVKAPKRDFQVWESSDVQRLTTAIKGDRLWAWSTWR